MKLIDLLRKSHSLFLLICLTVLSCRSKITCKKLTADYISVIDDIKTLRDTLDFVETLTDLLMKDPYCEKAYQIRGTMTMGNKKYSLAKSDFLSALKINDSSVYSLYFLSILYNLDNVNDSALRMVNKAIALKFDGKYVMEHNNLFSEKFDIPFNELVIWRGILLYELGLYDLAKNDFINSVGDNYELGESFAYLSAIYQIKNNLDSACYYQQAAFRNKFSEKIDSLPDLACP